MGEEWCRRDPKVSAAPRGKDVEWEGLIDGLEERFNRGWWVGEEWCRRDPKVLAAPRGKDSREEKKRERYSR